jgi:hypothetical protein
MKAWQNEGFKVYLNLVPKGSSLPPPTSSFITQWLELPSNGTCVYLAWKDVFAGISDEEKEAWLIELNNVSKSYGKKLAYRHGDGLDSVNATKLSTAGLIVWAWFWAGADFGPGWKPKIWDAFPIWVLNEVMGAEDTGDPAWRGYTTPQDIYAWYEKLISFGRVPEAIVWGLCQTKYNPTEEQQTAMGEVSQKYLLSITGMM